MGKPQRHKGRHCVVTRQVGTTGAEKEETAYVQKGGARSQWSYRIVRGVIGREGRCRERDRLRFELHVQELIMGSRRSEGEHNQQARPGHPRPL
jgi:hypothetical protein